MEKFESLLFFAAGITAAGVALVIFGALIGSDSVVTIGSSMVSQIVIAYYVKKTAHDAEELKTLRQELSALKRESSDRLQPI